MSKEELDEIIQISFANYKEVLNLLIQGNYEDSFRMIGESVLYSEEVFGDQSDEV